MRPGTKVNTLVALWLPDVLSFPPTGLGAHAAGASG